MPKSFQNTYIPPYSTVQLVECHDHFQLVPVAEKRFFCGYGKVKAGEAKFEDGSAEPIWDDLGPDDEVWMVALGHLFEDGAMVPGMVKYLRPSVSEEEVMRKMEDMKSFYITSRTEAVDLTRCYEAPNEDLDYVDDNYPNYQFRPTDPKKVDEQDLYDARLKVISELQPKTVELIKIAESTKDAEKRRFVERQTVQSYFSELAHYWTEAEVLAWQKSNPVGTGWLCEFGEVMQEPRKVIDPVNHELAFNWLKAKYNEMTAEKLSKTIFQRVLQWVMPDAIRKRWARLGLTTKRRPGPPPNQP